MRETIVEPPLQPFSKPEEIEARSLAIIDAEVPEPRRFTGHAWEVVRRMIHTTADFELLKLARIHPDALEAGIQALRSGCTIYTDTEMARCGIPVRRMEPLNCQVTCLLNDNRTAVLAKELDSTRSAAAVDVALEDSELGKSGLAGQIMVIGNAPTALIRLVRHMVDGKAAPALVVGMPVGFVNAAESKDLLESHGNTPYVTISGRKGGSALAASVINALAEIALRT